MNLTVNAESAETNLRQILEDFFVSQYDENTLPSHGLNHHRRVWHYATQLLSLHEREDLIKATDPTELMIACFLHDIGMSQDPGPAHGKHSREICENFLKHYNIRLRRPGHLLDTIEYHDRKDYKSNPKAPALLTILSVADDLDAYGFIGIYRYSEIYLMRAITPQELGTKIRENAGNRFDYLVSEFGAEEQFIQVQRKRYLILDNFFKHYINQLIDYDFNTAEPEGYCGVIQLINRMLRNGSSLSDFPDSSDNVMDDIVINTFFDGLKAEIASFK